MGKLQTAFHCGGTNLCSHQQCTSVPLPPHPRQHLLFLIFLIITILTGVKWYLTVVLISISLMISYAERLFMYLLAILSFFFGKMSVQLLCPFLYWIVWVFCFCFCFAIELLSSLYMLGINPLSDMTCKYFLPSYRLPFHFVDGFACCTEVF